MKQKDLALVVVIAFISAIASFLLSHVLFAAPQNRQQSAEVVQSISTSFPLPDSRYFNSSSIDPTQLIQIGNTTNPNPFTGNSQQAQ